MTPLDEGSARRRDIYLTTHNTHKRQNNHALGGIRTHNLSKRASADLRLRLRGQWDRHLALWVNIMNSCDRMDCFIRYVVAYRFETGIE